MISCTAITAGNRIAFHVRRKARIHFQSVKRRHDAKDSLCDGKKRPCGGTGKPTVFRLAVRWGILAGDHLRIDVRLGAVDFTDILEIGRAGTAINFKCTFPMAEDSFRTDDPGVVMAEDSRVLLVSRRITGNLTQIEVIVRISWLQKNDAVLRIKPLLHTLHCPGCLACFFPDASHDTHPLWFNKDLAFFAFFAADRSSKCIVCAAEPLSVPSGREDSLFHS